MNVSKEISSKTIELIQNEIKDLIPNLLNEAKELPDQKHLNREINVYNSQIHDGTKCNECGMSPIVGLRYICVI